MALFGRESRADAERAERVKQWVHERAPVSLFAVMFGVIAVVDFWTMVIGIAAGVTAIVLGVRGLREIKQHPGRRGRRLCRAAIAMGTLGLTLSFAFWLWLN